MRNSQILDQIKECAKIHHVVDFFGVGEVEAFEMLDDICAHFSNRDEAYGFLSFIKDKPTNDVLKVTCRKYVLDKVAKEMSNYNKHGLMSQETFKEVETRSMINSIVNFIDQYFPVQNKNALSVSVHDDNELTHNEKHGCDDPAYVRGDL